MRYLVIAPAGDPMPGTGALSMEAIQTLVGGEFEALPSPTGIQATVLAGTNAKTEGRPVNHGATRLLRDRLRPEDFVAGTVVVAGPITSDGDLTDLADDAAKAVGERVAP